MRWNRLLVLGLLLASCGVEIVEYDDFSDLGDDSPCGGTGGLCTIACSTDLDCVEYSDDAICGDAGVCEARSSCLGAEVCGPEARCSTDWNECRPLGRKPLRARRACTRRSALREPALGPASSPATQTGTAEPSSTAWSRTWTTKVDTGSARP